LLRLRALAYPCPFTKIATEPFYFRSRHRVIITVLGIETVMVEAPILGWEWDVFGLEGEVGHLEGTPEPANRATRCWQAMRLTGKGIRRVFWSLSSLAIGDHVVVEKGDTTLKYDVVEIRRARPCEVSVLYEATQRDPLSLMTCDENRDGTHQKWLIIIARRVG
jgi:LPXTG-site transpeptidase (sortase) family protein